MHQVDQLTFANGHQAMTVRLRRGGELDATLTHLKLTSPCPTLVLVGGASGLSADAMEYLRSLFTTVLAPFAEAQQLLVIDGGTDAGVMQLMGQARQSIQGTFPLLGVAAIGTVILPNAPPPKDGAHLEPNHSHFFLVPGAVWGDEAPWIARVATQLSFTQPSLTILVNGGKIAWQDVENSIREHRPVLVVGGSGRTADVLARAVWGDRTNDRANKLVDSQFLSAIDLFTETEALPAKLHQWLTSSHTTPNGHMPSPKHTTNS
ncbi:MAG: hypothetical protein AAFX78_03780 [Cyanobacteria bacterium J06638_20]